MSTNSPNRNAISDRGRAASKSRPRRAPNTRLGLGHWAAFIAVVAAYALAVWVALGLAGARPGVWRLDLASGGALLLNGWIAVQHVRLWRRLPRSRATVLEAFGATYDPGMSIRMLALLAAETAAFAEYAQAFEFTFPAGPAGRLAGLALAVSALALVARADRQLAAHFSGRTGAPRAPIVAGPYRMLRHPRYAGLLLSRVALALLLGSTIAWLLIPAWLLVVRRRIRLEEAHLDARFGPAYAAYRARTAGLIPWVY